MKLGAYDTISELGRGAMGVVFRARHRTTGAERALKVIQVEGNDPEAVKRFGREAASLARVDGHANIVRIHETGVEGNKAYYAMDLVEGRSLRARIEEGRLPVREACVLVAKIAKAIAHCHGSGIIHRDLKPENVLVDMEGEPQLVDFGLVRDLAGNKLTHTGTLIGTPAYMSPEQVIGDPATGAVDVHALGLILYEALTGKRAHQGNTVVEIANSIVSGKFTPIEIVRPDLPAALARAVARALSVNPAARPTASELARELEVVARTLAKGTKVVNAGELRAVRIALIALAIVAVLLAAAVVARLLRPKPDERLLAHQRLEALVTAAASLAGTNDAAALLAGRGAIDLAAATSESIAWSTLAATARAAIARAPEPLGLELATRAFEAAPAERKDELTVLRARARFDAGDLDGALADLALVRSPEARVLRAHFALLGRRAPVLAALEGDDPLCAAGRVVGNLLSGGDVAVARSEIRNLLGDRSDVASMLEEIAARRLLDGVISRAEDSVNAVLETREHPASFVDPCRQATVLFGRAAELPRYVDAAGDVAAIASTIALMSRDWRVFFPLTGGDEDAHSLELIQIATKLDDAARALVRNDDRASLPADVEMHWLSCRIGPILDKPGVEREERLRTWIGKAPPEREARLRTAVLDWETQFFMASKTASPSRLLEEVESTLPYVPENMMASTDEFSLRVKLEALACELCVRSVTERPKEAAALLARAQSHLEIARARGSTAGTMNGGQVARATVELALAEDDKARALEEVGRSRQQYDQSLPFQLLVGMVEVRWGEADRGRATIDAVNHAIRSLGRLDSETAWFEADGYATYWLIELGSKNHDDADHRLKEFGTRMEHPVLLPWIQKGIDEALAK
jgi:serine/threonine-protein kinase